MKLIKRILLFIFIAFIVLLSYFGVSGYNLYKASINEMSIENRVNNLKSSESFTKFSELPAYYVNAVIAIEDHRFYSHSGVDVLATTRALLYNVVTFKLHGGGSSITQQVAKNLCFTQEKTLTRKFAELFAVHDLEKMYDKKEIFEIYVNNMYFGHGYYNIHDAAEGYYNKAPQELTLYEATMLAGVPNAPSVYSPSVNMGLAEERQSQVLDAMVKYNYLSEEEANEIKAMQETK